MKPTPFDLIIFGATSFVGQILCRHLLAEFGHANAPGKRALRWAIAGRSREKLEALLKSLGATPDDIPLIVAEANDANALTAMAIQCRVVVSTVGPYALHGDTLVRVCAESGIDYCDLTGEAHWVRRMIDAHEATAKRSGARIVPCTGFDSIPSDLGVWHLQREAMKHDGEPCVRVKMRTRAMRGTASGGTVASGVNIVAEATRNPAVRAIYSNPYSLCPAQADGKSGYTSRQHHVKGAEFDQDFGVWVAPFIMAAINARVVLRSNAVAGFPYGRAFQYDEGMMTGRGMKGRWRATSFTAGLAAFGIGAAFAPSRWLMEKTLLPAPGTGPTLEAQEKGYWDFRFVGHTADGRDLFTKVTGTRDPGYGSTAMMLGEAAACLALDIPKAQVGGGFWTPATALGEALFTRLVEHAGVAFSVLEQGPAG